MWLAVLLPRDGTSRALRRPARYPDSPRPTKRVPETTKAQLLSEPGLLRVCWIDVSSSSHGCAGPIRLLEHAVFKAFSLRMVA